jgi:multidrug efflux system outer membrane protein
MRASSFMHRFRRSCFNPPSFEPRAILAILGFEALAVLLAGACISAPYHRPDVSIPPTFRGESSSSAGNAGSLGELHWQDLIHDEQLAKLIEEALSHNFDAQIAAARVLQAGAQLTIARAPLFPQVDVQASYVGSRLLAVDTGATNLSLSLGWQLDLWGQIRNLSVAARANLFANEEARRGVLQTVVSDVAAGYFLLGDFDLEREITRQALELREDSLALVKLRVDNGYSSELDLRQAEVLVESARTDLTNIELQIEQTEDQVDVLLGRNPGPIARGRSPLEQALPPKLAPGLPSALLDRRPDIREAEQQLIASHAQVAVAKAEYFPALALTSSAGFESSALHNLLSGASSVWSIGPAVAQPLFHAGSIRAGVRSAQALQEQALLSYESTVQQAFREVADALVASRKLADLRIQQEQLVESLRSAAELADLRYQGGVDSYLEYLDSERQLLDAQLLLVQIRRQEMTNFITLYVALGGGWQ